MHERTDRNEREKKSFFIYLAESGKRELETHKYNHTLMQKDTAADGCGAP
jgi:hypothetical protein